MLQSPVSETKESAAAGKPRSVQQFATELHPRVAGAVTSGYSAGAAGRAFSNRQGTQREAITRAQSAHGNQAVLQMLSASRNSTLVLQRKCSCEGSGGECANCNEKEETALQRRAGNQTEPNSVPPIVHEVLRSPGRALDGDIRAYMEPRFAQDFSQVRVHTDERAASSAHAVNADAYTVGRDIVFATGQYRPDTPGGQKTLAHELAHTIQQGKSTIERITGISQPTDVSEREADRIADHVVNAPPHGTEHTPEERAPLTPGRGSSPLSALQREAAEEENAGGAGEEVYEIGDEVLMAMPRWQIVALPTDTPAANSLGNGTSVLQRQGGAGATVPDACNTPQTMRKVISGKFEGGKTLDDYYPDLVGAKFWGKNDTAGPFDNGYRMGSAVQLISEFATPCLAGGSPFTFDQSITWVRLRADGKKVAEKGKVIEGQTYDDLAHSGRDKSKAPFRQEFDSAISIADPISGVPYAALKSYECEVNLTASVSGPGGSKSVNWGVTMEATNGKVTKNEVR